MARPPPRPSQVPVHLFVDDVDAGTDWHGNRFCAVCKLPGESGDERHQLPAAPAQAAHRARAGEREDD